MVVGFRFRRNPITGVLSIAIRWAATETLAAKREAAGSGSRGAKARETERVRCIRAWLEEDWPQRHSDTEGKAASEDLRLQAKRNRPSHL